MLRYGDRIVRVVVVAPDLLHFQVPQNAPEYHIKELDTAGVLHHAHIVDSDG